MALNKIRTYISLGGSIRDKIALALVGFIAPERDYSDKRLWRIFSRFIPNIWLRPKQLNGLRVLVKPTDWSQMVIFEEVFLQAGYDLNKVTFTPDIIFDCGAHIGIFSLLAKSKFPRSRLIAYEPNPDNARLILCQIAGNDLNVELVKSAISTEAKELYFEASNSHCGRLLKADSTHDRGYKVQVVNFPEALGQIKFNSVLLKIDIEGEELNVLPAIMPLLPRRSVLFFETHSGESGWLETETNLIANGFSVEKLNARGQFFDGFAIRE